MSSNTVNLKIRSITIRVFTAKGSFSNSHSYCVDDFPCGTCPIVGTVTIDPTATIISELRHKFEFSTTGNMYRRNSMFQEVLFIMSRLPNIYEKPKDQKYHYIFGFLKKDDLSLVLIPPSMESNTISSSISQLALYDLAIIPLTQVKENFEITEFGYQDEEAVDPYLLVNNQLESGS